MSEPARFPRRRARVVAAVVLLAGALAALGGCGGPDLSTVVLVTIDTLRADHVGAYGYPRPTTPFLDGLAARGVLFEAAYASSSHTAPSHATMFTSLYPQAHGVLRNGARLAEDELTTLGDVLREAEFTSGAFSGIGFLKQISGGFDHVDTWPIRGGSKQIRRAADTIARALDWMEGRAPDERLFLWVHLFDVHAYEQRRGPHMKLLPEVTGLDEEGAALYEAYLQRRYTGRRVTERLRRDLDRYDAQLAYTDRQIERLYRRIVETRGGNSLWIVTADHGEGLGNHGYMGHGRHLYDEQLRVPLIVHTSEPVWEPSRVRRMVRLVDLLPTLGELVGAPPDDDGMAGVSLVPLLESPDAEVPIESVFAQRRPAGERRWLQETVLATREGRYKYIYHSERPDELYDLDADPGELVNLAQEKEPEAARLRDSLLERYGLMLSERPVEEGEIEPEHLEELRALGYIN